MRVGIHTLAPLCHGGLDLAGAGNAVVIRREPIVSIPGMPRVPCLSGNSIRGQVRRHVMRELFRRAGLGVGDLPGKQWDMLYGALANGGHLTGSEKSPGPAGVRELRDLLPPLSVLGSAMYRYLLPGRCSFAFAWPVCEETVQAGLCVAPDGVPLLPAGEIVTETGMVRHIDRDEQDPAETGVTPMPVTMEGIATGVVMQTSVRFSAAATEIERSVIAWGLSQIYALGGKGAGGLGSVRIEHSGDVEPYMGWLEDTGGPALRTRLVGLAESIT